MAKAAKPKQRYGPEYPQQHYAEKMALEVGDSLSRFIEVINREFTSIKTKGISFSHIEITFGTKNMALTPNWCHVTIHSDLTGKLETQYGPEEEDSRHFTIVGRDALESAFSLIYHWKQELITYHQKELKPATQPDLFTNNK